MESGKQIALCKSERGGGGNRESKEGAPTLSFALLTVEYKIYSTASSLTLSSVVLWCAALRGLT